MTYAFSRKKLLSQQSNAGNHFSQMSNNYLQINHHKSTLQGLNLPLLSILSGQPTKWQHKKQIARSPTC